MKSNLMQIKGGKTDNPIFEIHTWEELSELYQRLCTADGIKKCHGIDVDWKTKTASELRELYYEYNKNLWQMQKCVNKNSSCSWNNQQFFR